MADKNSVIIRITPGRMNPDLPDSIKQLEGFFTDFSRTSITLGIDEQLEPDKSNSLDGLMASDLFASHNVATNKTIELIYFRQPPMRLAILAALREFKAEDWKSNGKIVGIHDLTKARFRIQAVWNVKSDSDVWSLASAMHHVKSQVSFGNFPCSLESLSSSTNSNAIYYEFRLPDADVILSSIPFLRTQ